MEEAKAQENCLLQLTCKGKKVMIENSLVTIHKKINEHTTARITGRITPDVYEENFALFNSNIDLKIEYKIETKTLLLFQGILTSISAQTEGFNNDLIYSIVIEAKSYTCLMDRKKKSRSFQQIGMQYEELIDEVIKDYKNAGRLLAEEIKGETLKGLTLQYQETDWEFLKRMASRFHAPLIPVCLLSSPKFRFGVTFKKRWTEWEEKDEVIRKEILAYLRKKQNSDIEFGENNYQYYELKTLGPDRETKEIGDQIHYQGKALYIYEIIITIKNHILSHEYVLAGKHGFQVPKLYNKQITGLSLPGKVSIVKGNQLKVSLAIDKNNAKAGACWLSYATFYSNFYCMPEEKDNINVYFPDEEESKAFVLNSVLQSMPQSEEKNSAQAISNQKEAAKKEEWKTSIGQSSLTSIGSALNTIETNTKSQNSTSAVMQEQVSASSTTETTNNKSDTKINEVAEESPTEVIDFSSNVNNNKIKTLATKEGKMIILDDDHSCVTILYNSNTYIKLSDGMMSICTNGNILLQSGGNMTFSTIGNLDIQGTTEITLKCENSSVVLKPEEIDITATDIKLNS